MRLRSSTCTQRHITRLIKAVVAAGIGVEHIARVELTRESAVLILADQKPRQNVDHLTNEWDQVLEDK